ncbi:MAG TPA: hypothetical protein PKE63_01260 [Lacibacter sp.]|nr:hypothetical protein [Lacibacter sp.]HMO88832.1 hypothetical protein [Lacibacter sp.]HMP85870.1 hypothetical protein [Lacibacter sp.]
MIRFFSGNNPLNVLLLFFLGVLLKLPYFLEPVVPQADDTDGFLYSLLLGWLQPAGTFFPSLYPILSYLLLFVQAVTFNGLINRQKLFPQPNLLLAFSFLLITSLVPDWNVLSPGLLINTVMVWAWPQMVGLYHNSQPKGNLFNLGFGFGVCSFIYFPSVYYLVLLIVALAIYRPVQITEWLVAIIGVLTPFYFLLVYFYVWDQWHLVQNLIPVHSLRLPNVPFNTSFWITFTLVNLPLVLGVLLSRRFVARMLVHARKSWSFMLVYLLVALFLPFINSHGGLSHFVLAAVPVSFFHAGFYTAPRNKRIPELLVWAGIAWVVINYFTVHG